jgi:hypothetical protein
MARIAVPPGEGNERARVYQHRPAFASGMQAFNSAVFLHTELSPREFEAVRMQIAMVNGCPI